MRSRSRRRGALDRATSCALRIDLGGLVEARVALDPAALPEAGDERISLLVTESACNSGDPATGRVELVELVETESTVIAVAVVRDVEPTTDTARRSWAAVDPAVIHSRCLGELGRIVG